MNTDLKENLLAFKTRQSPVAIFLIIQDLLQQLIRTAWPILLIIILRNFNISAQSSSSENGNYTTIFIAITALSAIGSIIAYFRFFYYVKDDEFIIEKGILRKKKINIPFDRIQSINFEQNLIHQAFNVVRFEVDTAGSNQKEASLQAIKKEDAEFIRSYIMSEKAKLSPSERVTDSETYEGIAVENHFSEKKVNQLLMHHNPLDLLKIGVSQNHLRGLGIILGFGFWLFQSLEDFLPDLQEGQNPMDYLEEDLGLVFNFSAFVSLFILLIVFSILISLIVTVFRYFDLKFFKTQGGFKVVSGLFTKREQSANINKIQVVNWRDSILKRIFGIFRLSLMQASSSQVSVKQSIAVPGCYKEQIDRVRAAYFPDETEMIYETHPISPLIIGRRVLFLGLIPASIVGLYTYLNHGWTALWWLLWIILIFGTSIFYHKNWKFHLSEKGVLTESGIFGTSFTLLKWYKIQSVKVRQSIYQRRKEVADLYFYTASGEVKIPYIPLEKALVIKNFVLYKVESSQENWM